MADSAARHGVFISYARNDGEPLARELHTRLQQEAPDLHTWMDRHGLQGGMGWLAQIEQQIDAAEFLLIVLTPAAVASENTRLEWRIARRRGVCVYPVLGVPVSELERLKLPRWMSRQHLYDPAAEWPKLVAHLRAGCTPLRVPFLAPPLPATHVPRPSESELVLAALVQDGRPAETTVTLRGPGGLGKSTLAAAVCHDDRTLDAFDDGVLWVTLGPAPKLLAELAKLYAALTGERPGFVDVEDAARELALKLEHRTCLFVIDDAWRVADIRPFLRGGPHCARLITTRAFDVALEGHRIDLAAMALDDAMRFLELRIGVDMSSRAALRDLAQRIGGWPLLLKLAGSEMRLRLARGDTLQRTVDYMKHALRERGVAAFDEAGSDRSGAVARTLDASLHLLEEPTQRHCAELSVFDEGEAVPMDAAAALWGLHAFDAEDLARQLDNLGLVELDLRSGTLRLHGLLREYLSRRLADAPAAHRRLLDTWGDLQALPNAHAWRTVARHLRCAGRPEVLRALLLDPRWLLAKLAATDAHALAADFAATDEDPVLGVVGAALRLAAPALATAPQELATQLVARLLGQVDPELQALVQAAARLNRGPWLRLLYPTLNTPGGMLLVTLTGHQGAVHALALDAAAGRLLSGSEDGSARLWNVANGQLLEQRDHLPLGARGVALADESGEALAACANGRLYAWRIGAADAPRSLSGRNRRALVAVAVTPDGRLAAVASRETFVELWDLRQGQRLRSLEGHQDEVTSVAISADGRRVVSGSEDGTLRVWHAGTGALEQVLRGHRGAVNAVALGANGRIALSGSVDQTLRLWDASRGEALGVLSGHESTVTSVALAEGGWRALSGAANAVALLWDLSSGQVLAHLEGHSDAVRAVAVDDSGRSAATASADGTVKLWRLDRLDRQAAPDRHAGAVHALAFSSDGRWCASGGADGDIVVRDTCSGQVLRRIVAAHPAAVRSLAFSADDSCLLSSGLEGGYWLWPIDEGDGSWLPLRHFAPLLDDALSSRYAVSTCGDRCIYVWELPSGARTARWGTRRLFDHLIQPAPQRAGDDRQLDIYLGVEPVYQVHAITRTAQPHRFVLNATRVEREAPRGLAGDTLCCLLVLDVEEGSVRSLQMPQATALRACVLGPCGERLLVAQADHRLALWDLSSQRLLTQLTGHRNRVSAVGFSADGRLGVSCAIDRSVRLWSLQSGAPLASFTADAALRTLAVAPGRAGLVAVGDSAGHVHLLRCEDPPD